MRYLISIALVLLAGAIIFAGCTGVPPSSVSLPKTSAASFPDTGSSGISPSLSGDWTLVAMGVQGGSQIINPIPEITLTIGPSIMNGNDGCTDYSVSYSLTGTTTTSGNGISLGPIQVPDIVCANNADEIQDYLDILSRVTAYAADPGKLTLTAGNGDALVFERPSPNPTALPPPY